MKLAKNKQNDVHFKFIDISGLSQLLFWQQTAKGCFILLDRSLPVLSSPVCDGVWCIILPVVTLRDTVKS